MTDFKLGPFTVGIDNVNPDGTLAFGAVRDAVNVDFDRRGGFKSRDGYTRVLTEDGLHSLWTSPATGVSLCVRARQVQLLTVASGAVVTAPLYTLQLDLPVSFDDLNDGIVFATTREIGLIAGNGAVSRLGIEDPAQPGVTIDSGNPTTPGVTSNPVTYGVAISFLAGSEESGLSPAAFVSGGVGNTLRLTLPQPVEGKVTKIRIYRTASNGDVLYRAGDAPLGITTWAVGTVDALGRQATNQFHRRLTQGSIVRYWNGRLLLADGSVLRFSQSMNYGLHDPRTDFVQFPHPINMIEAVGSTIFVGVENDGVYRLTGNDPGAFSLRRTGGKPVIDRASTRIAAADMGGLEENLNLHGENFALWLSRNGFVLGLADGRIVEIHRNLIRLPTEQWSAAGALTVHNRQAIAVLN